MKSAPALLLLAVLALLFAVVFSTAVLAQSSGPQAGYFSFARPVLYSAGFGAQSVAVADLNGDGHPDMIVVDARCYQCVQSQVSVLLGKGDGTFQPAINYSAGYQGQSVAVGDLNADGHLDVVIANTCQSMPNPVCPDGGAVTVLLGNGDGTFRPPVTYSSGGFNAVSAIIGKVAGGNKADILVANQCQYASNCDGSADGTVGVLLGKGDGTFRPAVMYDAGGVYPRSIAFFDTNQDGRPDIVVVNEFQCPGCNNSGFAVLLGNPNGTFQPQAIYALSGFGGSLAVGDVNGDGRPDLVVALCNEYSCQFSTNAIVLLGNGDGTFQDAGLYYSTGGSGEQFLTLADLNGDGWLDLVAVGVCRPGTDCRYISGTIAVLVGRSGGFLPTVTFNVGAYNPLAVVAADINADHRPDLVVANYCLKPTCNAKTGTGTLSVFLNNYFAATTIALTSSLNPSQVKQAVTFTATISTSDVPDGSMVTFYDGSTTLGTGTTSGDAATLTTTFSKAGKHTIQASYAGDAFHKASAGKLTQVVNP